MWQDFSDDYGYIDDVCNIELAMFIYKGVS